MEFFLDQIRIVIISFSTLVLIYLAYWECSLILQFHKFLRFIGIRMTFCSCWMIVKSSRKARVEYERDLKVATESHRERLYTRSYPKDFVPSPIEILLSIRAVSKEGQWLEGYKDFLLKYGYTSYEVQKLFGYIPERRVSEVLVPQLKMLATLKLIKLNVLNQFKVPEPESFLIDSVEQVLVILSDCVALPKNRTV